MSKTFKRVSNESIISDIDFILSMKKKPAPDASRKQLKANKPGKNTLLLNLVNRNNDVVKIIRDKNNLNNQRKRLEESLIVSRQTLRDRTPQNPHYNQRSQDEEPLDSFRIKLLQQRSKKQRKPYNVLYSNRQLIDKVRTQMLQDKLEDKETEVAFDDSRIKLDNREKLMINKNFNGLQEYNQFRRLNLNSSERNDKFMCGAKTNTNSAIKMADSARTEIMERGYLPVVREISCQNDQSINNEYRHQSPQRNQQQSQYMGIFPNRIQSQSKQSSKQKILDKYGSHGGSPDYTKDLQIHITPSHEVKSYNIVNFKIQKVNPYQIMAKIFDNRSVLTNAFSSTTRSSGFSLDNPDLDTKMRLKTQFHVKRDQDYYSSIYGPNQSLKRPVSQVKDFKQF
ncbi:UNKNOWN [Stylonychia lemnae]|uniref:Uncharacterized protein n=1 Tax=Stylonychia lemnae TaxID=5949 RepID=A0A078AWJ2_STYLE|nr:UNKNOWN [Stylonychia lemnae]|eukprot:CDW86524.1 UNKNOWN [Stylonychia lemnae]